jgi:hypothetical protein
MITSSWFARLLRRNTSDYNPRTDERTAEEPPYASTHKKARV